MDEVAPRLLRLCESAARNPRCCWGGQQLAASTGGDPSPEQHRGTAHCGMYSELSLSPQTQWLWWMEIQGVGLVATLSLC